MYIARRRKSILNNFFFANLIIILILLTFVYLISLSFNLKYLELSLSKNIKKKKSKENNSASIEKFNINNIKSSKNVSTDKSIFEKSKIRRPGLTDKQIEEIYNYYFSNKKETIEELNSPEKSLEIKKTIKDNKNKKIKKNNTNIKEKKIKESSKPVIELKKIEKIEIKNKKSDKKIEITTDEKEKKTNKTTEIKNEINPDLKNNLNKEDLIDKNEKKSYYSINNLLQENEKALTSIPAEYEISNENINSFTLEEKPEIVEFINRIKIGINRFPGKKIPCRISFYAEHGKVINIKIENKTNRSFGRAYEIHLISLIERTEIPFSLQQKKINLII
jgi:hypothetical protein